MNNIIIIILIFLLLYILIPINYLILLTLLCIIYIFYRHIKLHQRPLKNKVRIEVPQEIVDEEHQLPDFVDEPLDPEMIIDEEILNMTYKIANKFNLRKYRKHIYMTLLKYIDLYEEPLYIVFQFCDKIDPIKRMNIGTYIIWNVDEQMYIDKVYEEIIKISSDRIKYNTKIRSNAIDILMRSNNNKYIEVSKDLLEQLKKEERVYTNSVNVNEIRNAIVELKKQVEDEDDNNLELQEVLYQQIRELETRERNIINNQAMKNTVYNDTQNVHNSMINESVINISKILPENNNNRTINIEMELENNYKDYEMNKEKILSSLERINDDSAVFSEGVTIKDTFNKITNYIVSSPYKKELLQRLAEELVDMNGLCSTGHLSRLINVIQGFPDTPEELKIKMNPKDEIYASIQSYLNSEIQKSENAEQLLDYMIDVNPINKNKYLKFISDKMRIKKVLLEKEYGNLIDKETLYENIKESLNNYTMNENDTVIILNNSV